MDTPDNLTAWVAVGIALASLLVSGLAFQASWYNQQPRLHVDNWRIHDRVEYYTSQERDLEELAWGLSFQVHHAAGSPSELTSVEVLAKSPFVDRDPYLLPRQTPKRVVSPGTPYKSIVYNVPADYTVNVPPNPRSVLLQVTISYVDPRLFRSGTVYRSTFCGCFQAGRVADGRHQYIRAESWDSPIYECASRD